MPTATTRLLTLLGDPVSHSLSPTFQNAAIRHCRLDAVYVALRCDAQSVAPVMRALCRAGGGGNVTVPHKATAAQGVQKPTSAVLRTGACNTFWGEGDAICGDNTDVAGFAHAARLLVGELADARALVVGAGGAAAAAVSALLDGGAAGVVLVNRSPDRAAALARRLDPDGRRVRVAASTGELSGRGFDLAVNASSLGLRDGDPLPLDLSMLPAPGAVLDLVYRPGPSTTPWVSLARRLGIRAQDGREMLLGQGAAAFERWFGIAAPLDAMREALVRPPALPTS